MTDVHISRIRMAARRQGKLDGMREAARAICRQCRKYLPAERTHAHGRWLHATGAQKVVRCRASAIHDLITKEWGTSKPEADKT